MSEKLQRITRIDTRMQTYKVGELAPRTGGGIIRAIKQIDEGTFSVILDPYTTTRGDSDVEIQVERVILVFDATSADMEFTDPPMVQPANVMDMPKKGN